MSSDVELLRGLLDPNNFGKANIDDGETLHRKVLTVREVVDGARGLTEAETALIKEMVVAALLPCARALAERRAPPTPAHTESAVVCAELLRDFAADHSLQTAVELKNVAKAMMGKVGGSSKTRAAGMETIRRCVEAWPGSENASHLEAGQLERAVTTVITQPASKSPATVRREANRMLGALCRHYPEEIRDHADTVLGYLTTQLAAQMGATRQPEMPVIEGCLLALDDFLFSFGETLDEDDEAKEKLYDRLRLLCQRPDEDAGTRRTAFRCAVDLFSNHGAIFAKFVTADVKAWHGNLRDWAFSRNR